MTDNEALAWCKYHNASVDFGQDYVEVVLIVNGDVYCIYSDVGHHMPFPNAVKKARDLYESKTLSSISNILDYEGRSGQVSSPTNSD